MGVVTGKSQVFSFAGTTYDGDDCIQVSGLDDSINEAVYQCSGLDKSVAGTRAVMFTATLALNATDHAKINLLNPGNTGAFIFYPAGNTATYFKCTASNATIESANFSAPVNGVITVDLSIALDAMVYAAIT